MIKNVIGKPGTRWFQFPILLFNSNDIAYAMLIDVKVYPKISKDIAASIVDVKKENLKEGEHFVLKEILSIKIVYSKDKINNLYYFDEAHAKLVSDITRQVLLDERIYEFFVELLSDLFTKNYYLLYDELG